MKPFILALGMSFYLPIMGIAQNLEAIERYQETAFADWHKKDYPQAERAFLALSEQIHISLRANVFFSKKKAGDYTKKFQKSFDLLFSFIETHPSNPLSHSIYQNMLLLHNASVDNEITWREKLEYADKKTQQLVATKDSLLVQLERQYELPIDLRKNTIALETTADSIETEILQRLNTEKAYFMALSVELARQFYQTHPSPSSWSCYLNLKAQKGNEKLAAQLQNYNFLKKSMPLKWQYICDELGNQDAAIDFVAYHYRTPEIRKSTIHYGAWVLRKDWDVPHFIPLCDQTQLDLVLQDNVNDDAVYFQSLYAPKYKGLTLYDLIGKPLEPALQGIQKIYYAPAGDINRLNIAAIYPSTFDTTQQSMEFILINSLRSLICENTQQKQNILLPQIQLPCLLKDIPVDNELVDLILRDNICFEHHNPIETRDAVLFGNINYDMDTLYLKKSIKKTKSTYHGTRQLGKNGLWEALDHTKSEMDTIHTILKKDDYKVTLLSGNIATEEAFKELGKRKISPRIIHLATHGFFFPDTTQRNQGNPLNHSGLILTGANYAWEKQIPVTGREDGILTAFEIGQMNLKNTELVVLSACETGLGFIDNNEGVNGLQRAFKRAGVRNLVVSLWSVPDKATQLLMTAFYKNCVEKNMPIGVALKTAQQEVRQQDAYKNPYYWAAFILLE